MDPLEAQARAVIAAALIVRGAVEVPAIPSGRQALPDDAGVRLNHYMDVLRRELTQAGSVGTIVPLGEAAASGDVAPAACTAAPCGWGK